MKNISKNICKILVLAGILTQFLAYTAIAGEKKTGEAQSASCEQVATQDEVTSEQEAAPYKHADHSTVAATAE
ncbi:MAG: hypothetical protein AABZ06_08150 [Bdellovibrionota bacterium]